MKNVHMVGVLYTEAMFTWLSILSVFLFLLFSSSITIVLSEKVGLFANCGQLGSFIDCSGKQLTNISNELPSWTDKLKLNKNLLAGIPHFTADNNLTELSLGHNRISSISRTALEKLSSLEVLELNNNNISKIGSADFPVLPRLKSLNLNHNEISKIEDDCFSGLMNLTDLKINRNKLTSLGQSPFQSLGRLINLELNRNNLLEITWTTFKGLNSLKILELRQNNIEDVSDGAFHTLYHLRELHLNNNKLATISKGWLYGLESLNKLNVSSNKIHSLNNGWEACTHLVELDISNNKLEVIHKDTFKDLLNLVELKLDNNRISFVEDGAFDHLHSLQRLDLSNNLISWIVENRSGAFAPLKHLNRLWLSGNKISHISREAFAGLANVSHLDLSGNAVASIEENPFRSMPELRVLSLSTNSLICDCSLSWIIHWLNRTSVQRIGNLSCTYPAKLRRRPLNLMSTDEFVCNSNEHPKPHIITHPEDEIVVVGKNVTLHCGANSSVDAEMIFNWKLNNSRLENAIVKRYESAQGQGVSQYSDLILPLVTMANTGAYECVVSNVYGIAYSKPSQLSVFVAPSFKKTPSNVVEMVGRAAKLECVAEGFPTPKISWQKDGGSEFPAAFGRRMTVMYTGTEEPFFIVGLRLEDAGVYTCTAKNDAGTISWNATLTVLEAPSFSKQMKNKEVFLGEAAVLECMGKGSPKPNITWSKNSKPIALTKRHFLTAENQLLVITETSANDSGAYECELTNRLGSVRNKCELKVVPVSRFFSDNYDRVSTASEFTFTDVVAIVIASFVSSAVIISAVWVAIIHRTRRNRRTSRTPLSPIDVKSENSSHSSKDSGTGDSTKRSYQDLLLTTSNTNHASIMSNHSESPSPVPESTLPLLTTFHPIPVDPSPYIKENSSCMKAKHPTPVHYQNKLELEQQPPPHPAGIFCGSPASSTGIQCACLTATFKKTTADVCDCLVPNSSPLAHQCLVNHCAAAEHEVTCYGDLGKRPCSIPVPFHGAHSMTTTSCCRHHPNSYLCLYMPPAQRTIPQ